MRNKEQSLIRGAQSPADGVMEEGESLNQFVALSVKMIHIKSDEVKVGRKQRDLSADI